MCVHVCVHVGDVRCPRAQSWVSSLLYLYSLGDLNLSYCFKCHLYNDGFQMCTSNPKCSLLNISNLTNCLFDIFIWTTNRHVISSIFITELLKFLPNALQYSFALFNWWQLYLFIFQARKPSHTPLHHTPIQSIRYSW